MNASRRNLGFVAAASMALIVGGSAAVVAQGPLSGQGGSDTATEEMTQRRGGGGFFDRRGHGGRGRGGFGHRGRAGLRAPFGFRMGGNVIRIETIVNAGEDGFVTHRTEQGEVSAVSDNSISVSLANGETSEIAVTADTVVLAFGQNDGERRRRSFVTRATIADVNTGDPVTVTSQSSDGGPFEASRIVVRTPVATDAAESDAALGPTDTDATSASVQSA